MAVGVVAGRPGFSIGRRLRREPAFGAVDGTGSVWRFCGGVCWVPVCVRISQRAATGARERDGPFATRGKLARLFPGADCGACSPRWGAVRSVAAWGLAALESGFSESSRGGGDRRRGRAAVSPASLACAAHVLREAAAGAGDPRKRVLSGACLCRTPCVGAFRLAESLFCVCTDGLWRPSFCGIVAEAARPAQWKIGRGNTPTLASHTSRELDVREVVDRKRIAEP